MNGGVSGKIAPPISMAMGYGMIPIYRSHPASIRILPAFTLGRLGPSLGIMNYPKKCRLVVH